MQAIARNTFVQDSWQTPRNARTLAAYMALQNREIGERISALRKSKGNPPQEIVAQKLDVSNRAYQSWEAGDSKPSWRNLTKIAKFYKTSEEFILVGDEPEVPAEPTQLDRIELQLAVILGVLEKQVGADVLEAVRQDMQRAQPPGASGRQNRAG